MKLDVLSTAAAAHPANVLHKTACVIDVFRATSVMITALMNGAKQIIPVVTVEEAFELREQFSSDVKVILGGERKAVLIEGFDKDNSPLAYTREEVAGAVIIMSTTNGTRAIRNACVASDLYIGALLNADAVCERMLAHRRDMVIVCSGREDRFTLEDALCAGMMTDYILSKTSVEMTDEAWAVRELYLKYKDDFSQCLQHSLHYNKLMQIGRREDIRYCLQRNITDIVPRIDEAQMIVL